VAEAAVAPRSFESVSSRQAAAHQTMIRPHISCALAEGHLQPASAAAPIPQPGRRDPPPTRRAQRAMGHGLIWYVEDTRGTHTAPSRAMTASTQVPTTMERNESRVSRGSEPLA
jgi:hypothetical protein